MVDNLIFHLLNKSADNPNWPEIKKLRYSRILEKFEEETFSIRIFELLTTNVSTMTRVRHSLFFPQLFEVANGKKSDNDSHTAVLNVIRTDILLIDRRIHSSSYFFAARAATVLFINSSSLLLFENCLFLFVYRSLRMFSDDWKQFHLNGYLQYSIETLVLHVYVHMSIFHNVNGVVRLYNNVMYIINDAWSIPHMCKHMASNVHF